MANDFAGSLGNFATSLGLGGYGGSQLSGQVQDETEEERRKRLRGLFGQQGGQQGDRFSPLSNAGPGSIFGNTAASSIFGSYGR